MKLNRFLKHNLCIEKEEFESWKNMICEEIQNLTYSSKAIYNFEVDRKICKKNIGNKLIFFSDGLKLVIDIEGNY
jgi:hypothetical protein